MRESKTDRFDALVVPHFALLFRVAYKLARNMHDAQDLVQDTCVAFCEHGAEVDAAAQPQRWLLRVLHNRFVDGARRKRRAPFVPLDDGDTSLRLVSNLPGPQELLLQADDEHAFEQAFLQLEPAQRTLLTLRAEGYDLPEIEAITGIGREVLRARLHRARRSLVQKLKESSAEPLLSRAGSKA